MGVHGRDVDVNCRQQRLIPHPLWPYCWRSAVVCEFDDAGV